MGRQGGEGICRVCHPYLFRLGQGVEDSAASERPGPSGRVGKAAMQEKLGIGTFSICVISYGPIGSNNYKTLFVLGKYNFILLSSPLCSISLLLGLICYELGLF